MANYRRRHAITHDSCQIQGQNAPKIMQVAGTDELIIISIKPWGIE